MLDDNMLIEWGALYPMRNADPIPLVGGEPVPIEIYYCYERRPGDEIMSSLSFGYVDGDGDRVPVPEVYLSHPDNRTDIDVGGSGTFNVSVYSVDRAGHISDPITVQGYVDVEEPLMDLSGMDVWYNLVGCDDNYYTDGSVCFINTSYLVVDLVAGMEYYILVDGWSGEQ